MAPIKSNRPVARYFDFFSKTGKDAVTPAPLAPSYVGASGAFAAWGAGGGGGEEGCYGGGGGCAVGTLEFRCIQEPIRTIPGVHYDYANSYRSMFE